MIKVALIGAVNSTLATLKSMLVHQVEIACVLGYKVKPHEIVSGYANLEDISVANQIPYKSFWKINSEENVVFLKNYKPDVIFVVGLSQLVSREILDIPTLGVVGFHPTLLPKGRGRAPIAWLILEEKVGAANFFLMSESVDDGPIFVQEPFKIERDDDAGIIEGKIINAIEEALNKWLPKLKAGNWDPIEQDEYEATYYEKRAPEDGYINWSEDAKKIDRLIKASARPHPGAYTFYNDSMIVINNCQIEKNMKIKGVNGRILRIDENKRALIQCDEGLLWIWELTDDEGKAFFPKIGQKLGYYVEKEVFFLRKEIKELKEILDKK